MTRFTRLRLEVMMLCAILLALTLSPVDAFDKVRGVNLGGWLVVEGWIKPSLFDGIPNGDMLDGTQVQLKSVTLQKYISAVGGGGSNVTVDRDFASTWETLKLWRVSENQFQLRTLQGQFLTSANDNGLIMANADSPGMAETFFIERSSSRIHIKPLNGSYIQATADNALIANYQFQPDFGDDNAATFEMTIVANNLHGDYQLANGYGPEKAKTVLAEHRKTFITSNDFEFLWRNGINTVRIPVGWWIAQDPDPPSPFVGGSLAALDSAFSWAQAYDIKCIIDLHAAPGSQNGAEHSASRDGSVDWPSPAYISQTLDVINFLSARYANNTALLGIELLNEPSAASVPLDTLISYYKNGYQIVRNYSSTAYVIMCQRIGNADPMELYQANIGSSNIVLDLHYYNLFDPYFDNLTGVQNIQFVYNNRAVQLETLNSANGPLVFIGEWVNEWNVLNASKIQYQMFGRAQLDVFNKASFGWSYWTLKNDRPHWNFEWNIKNRFLLLSNSSVKLPNFFLLAALSCATFLLTISGFTR
ncbi:putative glucan 1,3-beta-glucosidase A [Carex littledalei]|uniref:Putative glucan 1,3-beta-glucosidase A n=1 Tax=Carex littledalei TaxID=544730 RepID=A0A833QAI7_9POAL|nr:putative glucan 1,3-beta-glucosidase A [Carex littledalei]